MDGEKAFSWPWSLSFPSNHRHILVFWFAPTMTISGSSLCEDISRKTTTEQVIKVFILLTGFTDY